MHTVGDVTRKSGSIDSNQFVAWRRQEHAAVSPPIAKLFLSGKAPLPHRIRHFLHVYWQDS